MTNWLFSSCSLLCCSYLGRRGKGEKYRSAFKAYQNKQTKFLEIKIRTKKQLLALWEEREGGKAQVGINMCKKTIPKNAVNKKPVEEKVI